MSRSTPDMGDYNELSVTTEYFFDSFFRSVFEDLPVSHDSTIVHVMLEDNDDPFMVDVLIGLDFVVPGEVPTVPFLLDWVEEAFERDASMNSYLWDLHSMSDTNPFSATKSVVIVRNIPQDAVGFSDGPGGPWTSDTYDDTDDDKKTVLISLISGLGVLILLLVGLLWVRQRRYGRRVVANEDELILDSGGSKSKNLKSLTVKSSSTQRFSKEEDDAVEYLSSIRERYKDEEDEQTVKTAFDDVDIPEERHLNHVPRQLSLDEDSSFDDTSVQQKPTIAKFQPYRDHQEEEDDRLRRSESSQSNWLEVDLAQSQSKDDDEEGKEEMSKAPPTTTMSKLDYLSMELNNASTEEEDLRY